MSSHTSDRRTPSSLATIFALALLLLLYIGSYLFLSNPGPIYFTIGERILPPGTPSDTHLICQPRYRHGGKFSETFFRPLQKIDQRFFPSRWSLPVAEDPTATYL